MPESSPFKYEKADDSSGFLLWKITALWQKKLAGVLNKFGITQTQYAILASLRWFEQQKGRPTQANLAEHTKIDKMTLSKAVRRLEKNALVRREASPEDSRAVNVRFTPQGRKLIQEAIVAVENADEELFSCLSEKQLKTYKSLILTLIANNDS